MNHADITPADLLFVQRLRTLKLCAHAANVPIEIAALVMISDTLKQTGDDLSNLRAYITKDDPESQSIAVLNLSVRAENTLRSQGVNTLGELRQKTDTDLLRIPNLGRLTLREIRNAQAVFDLETSA